jgi:hypothetical protein
MPAGSDERVALPRTFRPLGVRLAIYVLGVMLLVVCGVTWYAFPPETRAQFTVTERITLVVIGLLFAVSGYALARSRVVATEQGLTVVNGYRLRRFDWNQILGVTLRPGSPWAVLDLSDGTSAPAMGIQGSDGARANRQVRELRRLIDVLTRTERDD